MPKCAQLVSMDVCVCVSSDAVRGGGGGKGLFPFSSLLGCPFFTPSLLQVLWALVGEGTLLSLRLWQLVRALALVWHSAWAGEWDP